MRTAAHDDGPEQATARRRRRIAPGETHPEPWLDTSGKASYNLCVVRSAKDAQVAQLVEHMTEKLFNILR
jgi:hypothetical protein